MIKKTDLNKIKEESKILFDLVSFEDANNIIGMDGFIISHPFTNSGIKFNRNGQIMDLINNENDQKQFRDEVFSFIDKSDSLIKIMMLINKPYILLWFKLISDYLAIKDFSELLSEIWVLSENPNGDVNVSLDTCIKYFRSANKAYLMDEEEYTFYNNLPNKFIVYRGVSNGRNPKGLSYTLDKDKALWFQNRFATKDNPGFLIEREINKSDVLAYFNRRGESEIVLDTTSFRN